MPAIRRRRILSIRYDLLLIDTDVRLNNATLLWVERYPIRAL